ncbi:beta-catenin-like protein 1 [Macrosteles quadrilineatus]|uniref:beta-catenin-like protein 1 n=1 Tax=Macrosteles quadrilineatus TaxID=74068 RepID=UPI0023E2F5EF|nr:beta-catenin-like protein 1 [Macrosteles quadrilineatus]XP_054271141.1 beta-catenin-like protein 1 [Macrosteles quadrilineatus]XP_054272369.1 beta-catenin-like protein 1 [Macrosteles quadrilineatus]XP_054272370.1 beta-catenin-like protein 1 [Macrosteles quadrilineatus]
MDIGELLSYKPPNTPKRPLPEEEAEEPDETEYERQRKIRKLQKARAAELERLELERQIRLEREREEAERQAKEEQQDAIMKLVESHGEGEVLDEATLKRMVLQFEKRALRNQEMRIKFPDMPEKFMEAEIELHEALQEMHAVATVPDLYPIVVQLNAVPSMLELLSHENTDISVSIVDLLQELTDVDILHESQEGADALIDALLNQQICALLTQNLERLDETVKEEAEGVHNTLAIFENIMEFRPEVVVDVAKQGLLTWLLKRLRVKAPFDANKLYVSEILSILLQNSPENKTLLGTLDGIDVLLQQLAFYKRHDPQTTEEAEMMENLFDCLCSSLMITANKDKFLRGEGLQLMNLMLREKKLSRNGSLKVLNHAMSGPDGKDNCNKFVDILGLRTIFPLFMKTPKKNRKRVLTTEEHEEHVVSIIASMLHNCRGQQRQRLLSKFTENDHEKVDRLLELHFKYLDKVEEVDATLDSQRKGNDEENEDENYLKRLEGGLFTLQLIDYIVLEVCTSGITSIKQRVVQIINLRGGSLKTIRHVMREYAGNLGDAGDSEWKEMEQQHILQLVDKF